MQRGGWPAARSHGACQLHCDSFYRFTNFAVEQTNFEDRSIGTDRNGGLNFCRLENVKLCVVVINSHGRDPTISMIEVQSDFVALLRIVALARTARFVMAILALLLEGLFGRLHA